MSELSTAAKLDYTPAHGVTFADALRVWIRVALLRFGGPAGQIAVMHRILVEEKRWVSDDDSCTHSTTVCCCRVLKHNNWPHTLAG